MSATRRPRVTTEELLRELEPLLMRESSPRTSLVELERGGIAYESTFPLERLVARTSDGRVQRLVFKNLSRAGRDDPVWSIKPDFLHDPAREIETYLKVLEPHMITAPRCLGATVDAGRGRFWLFLEEIEGDPLWQIGDHAVWQEAAAWLARMHVRMASLTRDLPARLLVHDANHHRRWLERARRFVRWPEVDATDARSFDWLARRVLEAAEWAAALPTTFLHGEFYPSNVLIERVPGQARVRPVDWEMAAIGPGLMDLAALASGIWEKADREALGLAYREALPRDMRPSPVVMKADLDRFRLLLAVQWLGWSTDWLPPAEHARDWLGTALELAETVPTRSGARSL